jgi:hypothetical protein
MLKLNSNENSKESNGLRFYFSFEVFAVNSIGFITEFKVSWPRDCATRKNQFVFISLRRTGMTLASTAVKTAALLMMAPAAFLPMKADAQQMAAAGTPPHVSAAIEACHKLPKMIDREKCSLSVAAQENNRAAAASSQRADASSQRADASSQRADFGERQNDCGDKVLKGLANGTFKQPRFVELLAGRPPEKVDKCAVLEALKS